MNAYQLPEGYSCRPTTMDDVEAAVEMFNAWSQHHLGVSDHTVETLRRDWETPQFDLASSTRSVFDPEGKMVAYYELWDSGDPHVLLYLWGRVHPEHEGIGIGSYLLAWAEQRARETVLLAPEGARVTLLAWVLGSLEGAAKLFTNEGFKLIRHSLRMVIDLDEPPASPVLPEGVEIRTFRVGQDERGFFDTNQASFQDHWGHVERPDEVLYERFLHSIKENPTFDPELWYAAWEDGRIIGTSLCVKSLPEDDGLGWVNTLGVRREARRRGIAQALLQQSFVGLYERGQRRVGLGVDANSLTGATRLYEKAGMRSDPKRTYAFYEKELRPGVELARQEL
jgi:mycothiol synthase